MASLSVLLACHAPVTSRSVAARVLCKSTLDKPHQRTANPAWGHRRTAPSSELQRPPARQARIPNCFFLSRTPLTYAKREVQVPVHPVRTDCVRHAEGGGAWLGVGRTASCSTSSGSGIWAPNQAPAPANFAVAAAQVASTQGRGCALAPCSDSNGGSIVKGSRGMHGAGVAPRVSEGTRV